MIFDQSSALTRNQTDCTRPRSAVSTSTARHCCHMAEAARVATRRDGKWVYYRIASEDALAILGTLHQIYCA